MISVRRHPVFSPKNAKSDASRPFSALAGSNPRHAEVDCGEDHRRHCLELAVLEVAASVVDDVYYGIIHGAAPSFLVFFALGSIPKTGGEVPHFLSPTRAAIRLSSPETQNWGNSRSASPCVAGRRFDII